MISFEFNGLFRLRSPKHITSVKESRSIIIMFNIIDNVQNNTSANACCPCRTTFAFVYERTRETKKGNR